MKKIRAIVKRPDELYGHMTYISDTLENLQRTVEGYIEAVTVITEDPQVVIICNEEGRMLGLPHNCKINGIDFCGTIIALGTDGDSFADLPAAVTMKMWKRDFLEA